MTKEGASPIEAPSVDEDGTLHVAPFTLPPSPAWSAQARKVYLKRFTNNPVAGRGGVRRPETARSGGWPNSGPTAPGWSSSIAD